VLALRADRLLSPADRESLERPLEESFWRTNVEIICALSGESRRYERPGWFVGLTGALLCTGLLAAWGGSLPLAWGLWNARFGLGVVWYALAAAGGFAGGMVVGERWEWLRRLLVPPEQQTAAVEAAAALVFSAPRDPMRPRRLLVYASHFEHTVGILADPDVREALGDERLAELRDTVCRSFRQGRYLEGLLLGVQKATEWLEGLLPPEEFTFRDRPGRVWVFDPRPLR
jgi:uncharacterized membrane protein